MNQTIVQLDIKNSTSLIRRLKLPSIQDGRENDYALQKIVHERIIQKLKDLIKRGLETIHDDYTNYIKSESFPEIRDEFEQRLKTIHEDYKNCIKSDSSAKIRDEFEQRLKKIHEDYKNYHEHYKNHIESESFPKIRYEFDQAKIIFESVDNAHCFAVAVHEFTETDNKRYDESQNKGNEWFYLRIGIATGIIEQNYTQQLYRGSPFFRANRLEKKACPGVIVIDGYTYDALSNKYKEKYKGEITIRDYKDILLTEYKAWRYKVIDILYEDKQYDKQYDKQCLE